MKYMISFQCESHEEAQAVLTAVAAIGKQPHACSKEYVAPEEVAGSPVEPVRKNVSPGAPTIGKIGENAKTFILESLDMGVQPGTKYLEHCKLLWSRNAIGFDGEEFYI
jgi:hypothetical protein